MYRETFYGRHTAQHLLLTLFIILKKNYDKTCNLLLIENGNENHYVWIKDFNKLMNTQSKNSHKLFFCYYCLQHFTSEKSYRGLPQN